MIEIRVPQLKTKTRVYCLDPYDLCAAKLTRLEEKDRRYVTSLIESGDIEIDKLRKRVLMIDDRRFTIPLRAQSEDFLNAF